MIDAPVLLKDLQSQLRLLEADLRLRLEEDTLLRETLETEHAQALAVERTAASFGAWRDERVTQAAVAWLLACVFVRFAEDNHLVADIHLAGPGEQGRMAADAQMHYFQQHPTHNDRDWLLSAFRALSAYPASAPLFDERYNPLWQMPISADAASTLLEFWRRRDADTGALVHDFRDQSWETRFLGDLYQDLSELARKTYALLQTPEFVEEFLLDRTLEPAIAERGVHKLRMIDPTCGSGHFLLGGFARLLTHWRNQEPGTDDRVLVQRALGSVYGVDVNPFAVAIARFRLTVAALKESGLRRLGDAPAFRMNLAVGDSLLHGRREGIIPGMDDAALRLSDHAYATEDVNLLREILDPDHAYDVVVGNPPYIQVKDPALRAAYRKRYKVSVGNYALVVPFTVRFLELCQPSSPVGHVGMIVGSAFAKREFGAPLVHNFLAGVDVTHVIDTSKAYLPGHNTSTLILLARRQRPLKSDIRVVLGLTGEAGIPTPADQGVVWRQIVDRLDSPGWRSRFIEVVDLPRERLAIHPWSLGAGGKLRYELEARHPSRVGDKVLRIGMFGDSHAEDFMSVRAGTLARKGLPDRYWRPAYNGDQIKDWAFLPADEDVFLPYSASGELLPLPSSGEGLPFLWPFRTTLGNRRTFSGESYIQANRPYHAWHQLPRDADARPERAYFHKITSHNQALYARGAVPTKPSAFVVTFPAAVLPIEVVGTVGVLNSSIAAFMLKQVCYPKGGDNAGAEGARVVKNEWDERYEFNAANLKRLRIPEALPTVRAQRLCEILGGAVPEDENDEYVPRLPANASDGDARRRRGLSIALQEELDWECYLHYGVIDEDLTAPDGCIPALVLGERAFEIIMARRLAAGEQSTEWFARHGSAPVTTLPLHWPAAYRQVVERRIALIEESADLALVERPECKRRWQAEDWEQHERRALRDWLLDRLEGRGTWMADAAAGAQPVIRSISELADSLREDSEFLSVMARYTGRLDLDLVAELSKLVVEEAVPFLAVFRYSESGLRVREEWERTWALQRLEDAGQAVGAIPAPPKYSEKDFARKESWALRGKLDVPQERFISYPTAGRDADPTVMVGWAGWDHLQQAQALATLIVERREIDGWSPERLVPMLAGLAELEPWVHQWHAAVDPSYGTTPGAFYTEFLEDTLRECELTRDDLAAWRPPAPSRGRPRKTR
ncbi:BREX-2 system adenine-specific DNA-methyltransferase PglX [Geodermatophilus sp. SYSU D00965]